MNRSIYVTDVDSYHKKLIIVNSIDYVEPASHGCNIVFSSQRLVMKVLECIEEIEGMIN